MVALGDGENDVEMLSLVGAGVAVRNARPELKRVARYLTLSNDEGGPATVLEALAQSRQKDKSRGE